MKAKRIFILSGLVLLVSGILSCLIVGIKTIHFDDFKPASIIFVIDSSTYNRPKLKSQKSYIKRFCMQLDPDDKIKIIRVSKEANLIYEGSPQNVRTITNSLNSYVKCSYKDKEPAYGEAIKKAVSYSLLMKQEGYIPSIVVLGALENNGQSSKQINWNTLPKNIQITLKYIPDLTIMFLWASPAKLDLVKEKLSPILGEEHLIIGTEQMIDKVLRRFFKALGR